MPKPSRRTPKYELDHQSVLPNGPAQDILLAFAPSCPSWLIPGPFTCPWETPESYPSYQDPRRCPKKKGGQEAKCPSNTKPPQKKSLLPIHMDLAYVSQCQSKAVLRSTSSPATVTYTDHVFADCSLVPPVFPKETVHLSCQLAPSQYRCDHSCFSIGRTIFSHRMVCKFTGRGEKPLHVRASLVTIQR